MEIEYHVATGKTKGQKLSEVPDHLAHSLGKVTVQGGQYVAHGVESVVEGVASEVGKVGSSFIEGLGVWNFLLIAGGIIIAVLTLLKIFI